MKPLLRANFIVFHRRALWGRGRWLPGRESCAGVLMGFKIDVWLF